MWVCVSACGGAGHGGDDGGTATGGGEAAGGGVAATGGGVANTGGGVANTGGGVTNTGGGVAATGGGAANTGGGVASTGGGAATGGGSGSCTVPVVTMSHGSELPGSPVKHVLSTTLHPEALCNDGTPGTYVFRKGVGQGAKRWVIYLEGGGQCTTSADCADRWNSKNTHFYMSEASAIDNELYLPPKYNAFEGIKAPEPANNPDFYDANLVNLTYCSSDAWTGDRAGDSGKPITDVARWHFRGRKIIEAVLADLQAQGLSSAEEVFVMGSSAGGFGVTNNADDIRTMVPATARYVTMIDAGFFIDYPAFDSTTGVESAAVPTYREAELANAVLNWGGRGDASCEAAAKTDTEHALCRSVYDLLVGHHIAAPFFIRQSLYDNVQLNQLSGNDKTAAAAAYRLRFAKAMISKLQAVAGPQGLAMWASNDKQHGVINANSEWVASTVDGLLLPASITTWYQNPCAAFVHLAKP